MGDRHIELLAEFFSGFEIEDSFFEGKKVLDIGCWTGGTSISLYAHNAQPVVAVEEVVKYAHSCEKLIREVYEIAGFRCIPKSLYLADFDDDFDVVYCPGVVYHLSDPVLGLRTMFNALKNDGVIFVELAGINNAEPICRFEGNRIFHDNPDESVGQLNRGGWNWFLPSPACLERWLIEAGFLEPRVFFSPVTKRVFGFAKKMRFQEITRAGLSNPHIK